MIIFYLVYFVRPAICLPAPPHSVSGSYPLSLSFFLSFFLSSPLSVGLSPPSPSVSVSLSLPLSVSVSLSPLSLAPLSLFLSLCRSLSQCPRSAVTVWKRWLNILHPSIVMPNFVYQCSITPESDSHFLGEISCLP